MSSPGGPRADQPRRRAFTAEYKLAMVAGFAIGATAVVAHSTVIRFTIDSVST